MNAPQSNLHLSVATESRFGADGDGQPHFAPDAYLGEILAGTRGLKPEQIKHALEYQRAEGVRFGEAVVALGYCTPQDVVWALAQQFHYPYNPEQDGGHNEELVMANAPFSEQVEPFRDLRAQLMAGVLDHPGRRSALAIVSPNVGDGKSFIAANLAVAFSQVPGRTLLVDADLRTPRLHALFGITNETGLSSILVGRSEPNLVKPVAHLPNLYLLPAGPVAPNPAELLHRPAFGLLLAELLNKFDHVIVDTPAASHGADARMVATRCGASLVVGRKNHSSLPALQKLAAQLGKANIRQAGLLMNEY